MKSKTTALILSILLGGIGVDQFYLGYTGVGLLKLFTGGVFGILALVDIIRIATGALQPANGSEYEEDHQKRMSYGGTAAGAPQPGAYSQATAANNNMDALKKLYDLYTSGVITRTEYEEKRQKLMNDI